MKRALCIGIAVAALTTAAVGYEFLSSVRF